MWKPLQHFSKWQSLKHHWQKPMFKVFFWNHSALEMRMLWMFLSLSKCEVICFQMGSKPTVMVAYILPPFYTYRSRVSTWAQWLRQCLQLKCHLGCPYSHWSAKIQVPALLIIQFPTNAQAGRQQTTVQVGDSCVGLMGLPDWVLGSWLWPACYTSGCFRHVGNKPADGRSLSFSAL